MEMKNFDNNTHFNSVSDFFFVDPSLEIDEIEPCDAFDQKIPLEWLSL